MPPAIHVRPPLPDLQFGPHDLAGPAGHGLPAPPVAYRLDQHQAPAALVLGTGRSEEHTSELQSLRHLVCRLLLEKKKHKIRPAHTDLVQLDSAIGSPPRLPS